AALVEQRGLADREPGDPGAGHAAPDRRDLAAVAWVAVVPARGPHARARADALVLVVALRARQRAGGDEVEGEALWRALGLGCDQVVGGRLPDRGRELDAAQVRGVEAEQTVLVDGVVVAFAARVVEAQQVRGIDARVDVVQQLRRPVVDDLLVLRRQRALAGA